MAYFWYVENCIYMLVEFICDFILAYNLYYNVHVEESLTQGPK